MVYGRHKHLFRRPRLRISLDFEVAEDRETITEGMWSVITVGDADMYGLNVRRHRMIKGSDRKNCQAHGMMH